MNALPTLAIIGCGQMARVLGALWHIHGVFRITQVCNRTQASADAAVAFMGAGEAVDQIGAVQAADVYLIGTPDDAIVLRCQELAALGILLSTSTVFHCSGSLPSTILASARTVGAHVASVHPIRSFAQPNAVLHAFAGTWCGVEGDEAALALLEPAFMRISAQLARIDPTQKALYHAAAVFASNYLVTLVDVALQAYQQAGIPRETALAMVAPLVRHTSDNLLQSGPEQALSGPILRGDRETVRNQYRAVHSWDRRHGRLYCQLGRLTALLARRIHQGTPRK